MRLAVSDPDPGHRQRAKLVAAFAVIYLVWGSTFLVTRIGVLRMPPLLFAAARFVLAGTLLVAAALALRERFPATRREWLHAGLFALLMVPLSNGLSTVLTGASSFEDTVVRAVQHPNLDVLPAGPLPPHPSELLSSHVMNQHLEEWCRRYDFVILDSPPVLAVTDAVLISVKVDAVLLVVRAGQTSKNALRRARNLLGQVGARVMGIVVNGVNIKSPDHYYNYFYGSSENKQYYTDKVTSI